jgi:hypothetical protein
VVRNGHGHRGSGAWRIALLPVYLAVLVAVVRLMVGRFLITAEDQDAPRPACSRCSVSG